MSIKKKIKHAISFLLHGEPKQVTAKIVTLAPSELLKDRCALITGGTSGIGFSIAEAFLKAGVKGGCYNWKKSRENRFCLQKIKQVWGVLRSSNG